MRNCVCCYLSKFPSRIICLYSLSAKNIFKKHYITLYNHDYIKDLCSKKLRPIQGVAQGNFTQDLYKSFRFARNIQVNQGFLVSNRLPEKAGANYFWNMFL